MLLGAALMIGAPAITSLPGCGGGGSGVNQQILNDLQIDLGNGQTAKLDLTITGTNLVGTLDVPAPLLAKDAVTPKAINFTIPPGLYNLSGTFSPPRGFAAQGTYTDGSGATVNFTVSGQIPTTSSAGSFAFTALGQTVNGTIPPIGQATPTPSGTVTPTPTGTPTATPTTTGLFFNGTISLPQNSNVTTGNVNIPFQSGSLGTVEGGAFVAIFQDPATANIKRAIQFEVTPPSGTFRVGDQVSLTGTNGLSLFESVNGANNKIYDSASGILKITAIAGDDISFAVQNARLSGRTGSGTGSFTLNGTGKAHVQRTTGGG